MSRAYTRAVLKKQMEDADSLAKQQFLEKVQESVEATERDNKTRLEDATDFFTKYQYLKTFRDDNKRVRLPLKCATITLRGRDNKLLKFLKS